MLEQTGLAYESGKDEGGPQEWDNRDTDHGHRQKEGSESSQGQCQHPEQKGGDTPEFEGINRRLN
jgi:hypothetical protein